MAAIHFIVVVTIPVEIDAVGGTAHATVTFHAHSSRIAATILKSCVK